jgi:4-aminobutyrate aminotransferase-like enzyme/Ser/Thr protein kinase RdoA (MazF antagonist)
MSAPVITQEQVLQIVESLYGVRGTLSELGSCQDVNYKLKTASGDAYVVKIANSAATKEEMEFQNRIMIHLSSNPELSNLYKFPTPLRQLDGHSLYSVVSLEGNNHFIRLLTFVKGAILSDTVYFYPEVLRSLGECVAKICKGLTDFDVSGMQVPEFTQWDLQNAQNVITELLPKITDEPSRSKLSAVSSAAFQMLEPLKSFLSKQIVHGDLAHYNLVSKRGSDGCSQVAGVIDFGDAMRSWTVGDLAVCITSGFEYDGWKRNALLQTGEVLKGFISVTPLNEQEIESLWPLILIRSVVNIVCINNELLLEPDNPYNIDGLNKEWTIFNRITSFETQLAVETLRSVADLPISPSLSCPLTDYLFSVNDLLRIPNGVSALSEVDLGYESDFYSGGAWLNPTAVKQFINGCSAGISYAEYGVPRFYLGLERSLREPATVPLGADVFVSVGTQVTAPFDCKIYEGSDENSVIMHTVYFDMVLRGVQLLDGFQSVGRLFDSALAVSKGSIIGTVTDTNDPFLPAHLNVQISKMRVHSMKHALPRFCQPSMLPYWSLICVAPTALFGLGSSNRWMVSAHIAEHAVQKRATYVAAVQQHYFTIPPCIERGHGAFLYDISGRAYLDVVNNVALVGHCNRRVVAAALRQSQMLNTNSRFIYLQLGLFAEKIVGTMPKESKLEVVFFVNSGSEATDLAQRLARTVVAQRRRNAAPSVSDCTATDELSVLKAKLQNRNIVCLEGAYHGITTASDEISTTLNDNPRSRESRPPWIHLARMPNPYRGIQTYPSYSSGEKHLHEAAAQVYADSVDTIVDELAARGDAPVAFIAEPLSGNAGGVELPVGYLQRVYAKIRSVGGLCISDEVQVGYGRLGTKFWGFEEHGVMPDIITMAKAAGNGHPLGFVVTSREIANEFGVDGSFFSSAGGGPVSCAVGKAVLEEIARLDLQNNAFTVGTYLRTTLLTLVEKFPETVGAIHGHGLYMGIEIIKDSSSRAPGTEEAYAICRRLLDLGVICHNTGDYSNVLKVKPPLVMTKEDADFFIVALTEAFQGW